MQEVAVLFARRDSIYKKLPGCDVYDIDRNALHYAGGAPVVAHPPCRGWGKLRGLAKPAEGERELALWAIEEVRQWGGVLEHPEGSALWKPHKGIKPACPAACLHQCPWPRPKPRLYGAALPTGSTFDHWGGWTMKIDQSWWGHKARKRTYLYIVGCSPAQIPPYPISFDCPPKTVTSCRKNARKSKEISKAEREHTPPALAEWMLEVARLCQAYRAHR